MALRFQKPLEMGNHRPLGGKFFGENTLGKARFYAFGAVDFSFILVFGMVPEGFPIALWTPSARPLPCFLIFAGTGYSLYGFCPLTIIMKHNKPVTWVCTRRGQGGNRKAPLSRPQARFSLQKSQVAWKQSPQSAIQCANRNQNSQFIGVRAYGMTSRMLSTPVR